MKERKKRMNEWILRKGVKSDKERSKERKTEREIKKVEKIYLKISWWLIKRVIEKMKKKRKKRWVRFGFMIYQPLWIILCHFRYIFYL